MKHIFTFLTFACAALIDEPVLASRSIVAADTIYLKSGDRKIAEIREVYPDVVKYRSGDGKNLISLPVADLTEIAYKNGSRDIFNPLNRGGKPEIRWLRNPAQSDKQEIRLNACVLNEAENIRVEVNGTVNPVATRSFKTMAAQEEGCVGGTLVSPQIVLNDGKNTIRLLASNGKGTGYSETWSIDYEKTKKRIALVVGNSGYQSGSKLQNP
jgi:hypothetical protein